MSGKEKQKDSKGSETLKQGTELEDRTSELSAVSKSAASGKETNLTQTEQSGKTESEVDKTPEKSSKEEQEDTNAVNSKTDSETPVKQTEKIETVEDDKVKIDPETSANLIKSPSSQSIQRPEPDHTQDQENVLEKLAEAAKPQVRV